MASDSVSNSLHAFNLLREAAREYNNSEFKFYKFGFFKFVREGKHTMLIEDIYIRPEHRGTPAAALMLGEFEKFLKSEQIFTYYGRVMKGSPNYEKRVETVKRWGMRAHDSNEFYTLVMGDVK